MHVNDLPPELIHLIFKKLIPTTAASLLCWKENFDLLQVCQKWRQCAVPIIYSQALLAICDSTSKVDKQLQWLGNLDLIGSLNMPAIIKSIKVCLNSKQGIQPILDDFLLCLSQYKTYLGSINSFSLELCISKPVYFNDELNGYFDEKANLIRYTMPNLQSLTLYGSDGDVEKQLSKHLCHLYLPQLSRLACQYTIPYAFSQVPVHLTMLKIAFGASAAIYLPHSIAETLRYLHLHNVPQDYTWSSLLAHKSASKVVFSKLIHFSLSYSPVVSASESAMQKANTRHIELHFPKLQTLFVCGSPSNCKVLTASKFPSIMHSIIAVASAKALEQFQHKVPSRVDTLNISAISPVLGTQSKFSKAINKLFGQVQTENTHLVLEKSFQLVELSNINWRYLQKLMISTRVSSTSLLEIIHRTPGLKELVAFCIYIDNEITQQPVPSYKMESASDIEELNIAFDMDENTRTTIQLVQYMLIQLPRLKKLLCTALFGCPALYDFIEASQAEYPHLTAVSITSFP